MIRAATPADIETIVGMGREFHSAAGWGDIADYDDTTTALTLRNMIDSEAMVLLVAEQDGEVVGMAGGGMAPLYFNHAHRIGQEIFYWINPEARNGIGKHLLDELENTARAAGCQSWIMVALDNVRPEVTGRLYRMRGYRPAERNWIRKL
ncbi:MAG: GNAT family N-acetyltransferase [Pseudomonadota bacterium]